MNTISRVQESKSCPSMGEQSRVEHAKQIRPIRVMRGMSQNDLAEAAGVSRGTIINAESGRIVPQPDKLFHIMQALDMVVDPRLDLPEWVAGNLEIIGALLVRVPEHQRAAVLSDIFTVLVRHPSAGMNES